MQELAERVIASANLVKAWKSIWRVRRAFDRMACAGAA
jgi:hypothetical protein